MKLLRAILVIATVVLTGCHADVTYRLDIHPNNTVTVAINEKVDEQFFNMAQNQKADAFDVSAAQQAGWNVSKTVDDDDNHVFVITKTVPLDQLGQAMSTNNTSKFSDRIPLGSDMMSTSSGLFTDTRTLSLTVPPLMPPDASDKSNPYAGMASTMAASILSIHLELKSPGNVLLTNGETTSEGFTRWTLGLNNPTHITYRVQSIDILHVIIAIILLAIAATLFVTFRRKPKPAIIAAEGPQRAP